VSEEWQEAEEEIALLRGRLKGLKPLDKRESASLLLKAARDEKGSMPEFARDLADNRGTSTGDRAADAYEAMTAGAIYEALSAVRWYSTKAMEAPVLSYSRKFGVPPPQSAMPGRTLAESLRWREKPVGPPPPLPKAIQVVSDLADALPAAVEEQLNRTGAAITQVMRPITDPLKAIGDLYVRASDQIQMGVLDFLSGQATLDDLFAFRRTPRMREIKEAEDGLAYKQQAWAEWTANQTIDSAGGRILRSIVGEDAGKAIGMTFGVGIASLTDWLGDPLLVAGATLRLPQRALKGVDTLAGMGMRWMASTPARGLFGKTAFGRTLASLAHDDTALRVFAMYPAEDVRILAKVQDALTGEVRGKILSNARWRKLIVRDRPSFFRTVSELLAEEPIFEKRRDMVRGVLDGIHRAIQEDAEIALRSRGRTFRKVAKRIKAHGEEGQAIRNIQDQYADEYTRAWIAATPRRVFLPDELDAMARVIHEQALRRGPVGDDLLKLHDSRSALLSAMRLRDLVRRGETKLYGPEEADAMVERALELYRQQRQRVRAKPWSELIRGREEAAAPMLWGADADPFLPGRIPEAIQALDRTQKGLPTRMFRRYLQIARAQLYNAISLKADLAADGLRPLMKLQAEEDIQAFLRPFGAKVPLHEAKQAVAKLLINGGLPPILVEARGARSKINYFVRYRSPQLTGRNQYRYVSEGFETVAQASRRSRQLSDAGIDSSLHYGPGLLANRSIQDVAGGALAARRILNTLGADLVDLGLLDARTYIRRGGRYVPRLFETLSDPDAFYDELFADDRRLYERFREVAPKKLEEIEEGLVRAEPRLVTSSGAERRLDMRHDAWTVKYPFKYRDAAGNIREEELWWTYRPSSPPGAGAQDLGQDLAKVEGMVGRPARGGAAHAVIDWETPVGRRARETAERLANDAAKKSGRAAELVLGDVRLADVPLTADALAVMRQVDRPITLSAKGMADMTRMVYQARFFSHIARIPGIAEADAAAAIGRWGRDGAIRLPQGIKALGPLRGQIVSSWTWELIRDLYRVPSFFERMVRSPMVMGKTILSIPITWMRNFVSNFVYADYMGVAPWNPLSWRYWVGAMRHAASRSGAFREFQVLGGEAGLWSETEFTSLARQMLTSWERNKPSVLKTLGGAVRGLRKGYNSLDVIPKFAGYLRQLDRGASPEEAMAIVRAFSPDYALLPQMFDTLPPIQRLGGRNWWRLATARRSPIGPWFVPFSVENLRVQVNAARYHPLKLIKWLSLNTGMTTESLLRSGMDPDRFAMLSGALGMADPLSSSPSDYPWSLDGALVQVGDRKWSWMPWNDVFPVWGGMRYWRQGGRLRTVLPQGVVTNVLDAALDQFALGPGYDMIQQFFTLLQSGRDARTGTQVVPRDASYSERMRVLVSKAAEMLLPPTMPELPGLTDGGTTWRKARDLIDGPIPDRVGRMQSLTARAIRLLGLNVRELDDRHIAAWIVSQFYDDRVQITPPAEYLAAISEFRKGLRGIDVRELSVADVQALEGFQEMKKYRESEFMREHNLDTWEDVEAVASENSTIARDLARKQRDWLIDAWLTAKFGDNARTFRHMGLDKQMPAALLMMRVGITPEAFEPYRLLLQQKLQGRGAMSSDAQMELVLKMSAELRKAGFNPDVLKAPPPRSAFLKEPWEATWLRLARSIAGRRQEGAE